jgi:anti-sigma B factor antagonist
MNIELEHPTSDQIIVRPQGRVDVESASVLRENLKSIAAESPSLVVVDLKEVDFIDSSGLSALVSGLKALRQSGGSISLSRPHPQALTALRLTLLDRVFPIFPSVEEALEQVNPLMP